MRHIRHRTLYKLARQKLDRPVKLAFEREEVFYAHRGRHPTRMWVKMGMKKRWDHHGHRFSGHRSEGGAYASYGVVTAFYLGVFLGMPYTVDNFRFTTVRLYTNHPHVDPNADMVLFNPVLRSRHISTKWPTPWTSIRSRC